MCNGNWDDLPTAPIKIPKPASVKVMPAIASPPEIESKIGANVKTPTAE